MTRYQPASTALAVAGAASDRLPQTAVPADAGPPVVLFHACSAEGGQP